MTRLIKTNKSFQLILNNVFFCYIKAKHYIYLKSQMIRSDNDLCIGTTFSALGQLIKISYFIIILGLWLDLVENNLRPPVAAGFSTRDFSFPATLYALRYTLENSIKHSLILYLEVYVRKPSALHPNGSLFAETPFSELKPPFLVAFTSYQLGNIIRLYYLWSAFFYRKLK